MLRRMNTLEPHRTEELDATAPDDDVEPPRGGYRVAADEFRSQELLQELAETKARYKALERQLWAARKSARLGKARATAAVLSSTGGVGATFATIFAGALYLFGIATDPGILLALVVVGFILGAAIFRKRSDDEDDGFPPAPPPRWS